MATHPSSPPPPGLWCDYHPFDAATRTLTATVPVSGANPVDTRTLTITFCDAVSCESAARIDARWAHADEASIDIQPTTTYRQRLARAGGDVFALLGPLDDDEAF